MGNESPKDQNISEPNESGILGSKDEQHALREWSEASGMRTTKTDNSGNGIQL